MKSSELLDALETVRRFVEGQSLDSWEWGDFLSLPATDQTVRELQGFSLQLAVDYPPIDKTQYCSEEGVRQLRRRLEELDKVT